MNRFVSLGELRLGVRLIARQPILSATIILALATGICLATMGFTFRDALLNSTLPYAAGDRFGQVFASNRDGGRLDLDLERYRAFRDRAASFAHVGAAMGRPFTLAHGPGNVESISGALLTPRTMSWVEAVPALGRSLIAADGQPGAEHVVVIRDSLWRRRYAADPSIIGRAIAIGGEARTVVGVMQVLTAQLGRIPEPARRDTMIDATRRMPGVVAAGAGQQLPRLYPWPRGVVVEAIGDEPTLAALRAPGPAVGHGFSRQSARGPCPDACSPLLRAD